MTKQIKKKERTENQIREHYEIEKKLANRLRNASKKERCNLYSCLYDELYKLVPHHPQLLRKTSFRHRQQAVDNNMELIGSFLDKDTSYLEVGPGDCSLALAVAKKVKKVYAVDVSEIISKSSNLPDNLQLFISDGCSIPLPKNAIDFAFSNQLMEHLHSDDAYEQLINIFNVLAPGGAYLCVTPNRLNGPHDISKYFDTVAAGFHLKEYTVAELSKLFKKVGFSKVLMYWGAEANTSKYPFSRLLFAKEL